MIVWFMGTEKKMNIVLAAEDTPRSVSLAGMIRDGFRNSVSVQIVNISDKNISEINKNTDVCIVDLLSSQLSAVSLFNGLKELMPGSKIIVLHIYKSYKLIEPLYNLGIDGYLYSDPPRDELIQAIREVADGKCYYPEFLSVDKNT